MNTAAPGTGEEAIHRLIFEQAHGARRLAQIRGVGHEHGVCGFDKPKEADTERAAIDEVGRPERRVGSQPFDQSDADAIVAKQDIAHSQHEDVRWRGLACFRHGIHGVIFPMTSHDFHRHDATPRRLRRE
jgi:hypothetical protein